MLAPDVSRRLARAVNRGATYDERATIVAAAQALDQADPTPATIAGWNDLPAEVRDLVTEIEARPDTTPA